ncbi:hypothetical protein P7H12_14600 [Paenibacillus larvae]|nr:binary toxin-like calcium binding domain-containing protein [Paenibacillus larvae]MDT2264560.1 hypothetical protein [Paenibacillus larvae]
MGSQRILCEKQYSRFLGLKRDPKEEEELIKQGFKKFVSNPNESHTAGDPYSDLEKASGAFDVQFTKQPGTLLLRHIPVLQLAWKN